MKLRTIGTSLASIILFGLANDSISMQEKQIINPWASEKVQKIQIEEYRKKCEDKPYVLIIGDSISRGYYPWLFKELKKKDSFAKRIEDNAKTSENMLENLNDYILNTWSNSNQRIPDIILMNAGLHDMFQIHNTENKNQLKRRINIQEYEKNLEKIIKKTKKITKNQSEIYWVETTPIPEGNIHMNPSDPIEYNAAANALMKKYGIEVIPIYDFLANHKNIKSFRLKEGDVHFKPKGSFVISKYIANAIENSLKNLHLKKYSE